MARLQDADVDSVDAATDLVAVVSRYVDLRKMGALLKGICPFHSEKTPSFTVYGQEGFWKCYGCGLGGRVIDFVARVEGLGYRDAVYKLASEASIHIHGTNEPELPEGSLTPQGVDAALVMLSLNPDSGTCDCPVCGARGDVSRAGVTWGFSCTCGLKVGIIRLAWLAIGVNPAGSGALGVLFRCWGPVGVTVAPVVEQGGYVVGGVHATRRRKASGGSYGPGVRQAAPLHVWKVEALEKRLGDARTAAPKEDVSRIDGMSTEEGVAYLVGRGVLASAAERWGVKYDARCRRVVLPVYDCLGNYHGSTDRLVWDKPYCFGCGTDIHHGMCPSCDRLYAKYLHTSGMAKSVLLYGEHMIVEGSVAVMVEGPMDVIGMWSHGIRSPLGTFGTSVSEMQVAWVASRFSRVFVCGDGDKAGRKFNRDVSAMLRNFRVDAQVIALADGIDPGGVTYEQSTSVFPEDVFFGDCWLTDA